MFNQRLRLFRGNTFFAVGRHVWRLLWLLAFHHYVDQLLVRQTRIELLLRLLPVTRNALCLVGRGGIELIVVPGRAVAAKTAAANESAASIAATVMIFRVFIITQCLYSVYQ